MSTIFGVVHWDGRPASRRMLERMSASVQSFGRDREGLWLNGQAGLGCRLSRLLAEDAYDQQPCVLENGSVLVVDGRLDDRRDTSRALAVDAGGDRPWSDAALIARAWERWGDGMPRRVIGPMALAVWDARKRRLILARSPFCPRPLFYARLANTVVWGGRPRSIFASGLLRREIDLSALADHVALERSHTGSLFESVRSVPAGQCLVLTERGDTVLSRWEPPPRQRADLSDAEYLEAFLEVFTRAVADATRGIGPVGIMLSGGLDSSSVAALAAPVVAQQGRPLLSYTEVSPPGDESLPPGRCADEAPRVRSLTAMYPQIAPHFIVSGGQSPLEGLEARFNASEHISRGLSNLVWWDALMQRASQAGVSTMLTGIAGNTTVSWRGGPEAAAMLQAGRLGPAMREISSIARMTRDGWLRVAAREAVLPLLSDRWYAAVRHLLTGGADPARPWRRYAPVRAEFIRTHRVDERAHALGPDHRLRVRADSRPHRLLMCDRTIELHVDHLTGCVSQFGLDVRDPTADPRVVEFCLSVPERLYAGGGHRRQLLRRAMSGRLPDDILTTNQRGLQAAGWLRDLVAHQSQILDALDDMARDDLASAVIDVPALRQLALTLPSANAATVEVVADLRGRLLFGLGTAGFLRWVRVTASAEAGQTW